MAMKLMFYILIIVFLGCFLTDSYSSGGSPVSNSLKIELGGEWMYGYTLYKIGGLVTEPNGTSGNAPFPLSEIKYPLNIFLVTLKGDWSFIDRFEIALDFKMSLTSNNGLIEDSDWGSDTDPTALVSYSTSDSTLNFFSIDPVFLYKIYSENSFSVSVGPGFLFQHYYMTASDLNQTSQAYGSGYVPGEVSTYELYQYMFYGAIKLNYTSDLVIIDFLAGISPVFSSDDDNHILRDKENKASSTGFGAILRLELSRNISDNIFIALKGDYIYITTSGTQQQSYYSAPNEDGAPVGLADTINYTQESMQFTAGLDIGIVF
jgi:outer membrane protease